MPATISEIAARIAELEQQLERSMAEEVEAKRREFLDFGDAWAYRKELSTLRAALKS